MDDFYIFLLKWELKNSSLSPGIFSALYSLCVSAGERLDADRIFESKRKGTFYWYQLPK